MKGNDDWWWRMPQQGISQTKIDAKLKRALKDCIDYERQAVLGFPGTTPTEVSLRTHRRFARRQPNNIGYHTREDDEEPSEIGFVGTQRLEKNLIYAVADMIGVADPKTEVDGYVCNGGTDGNYHGLWLARNKLWAERRIRPHEQRGEIVILHSHLFHYSLLKAVGRLLGSDPGDRSKTNGITEELSTDDKGELEPKTVEECVRQYWREGYRRFAVFLTVGTTNLGSVDPIGEINETLERLMAELGIAVTIHVDAAFGGFVLPFTEPDCHFAFQHSLVNSVVLDAHKTGGVLYPAGIFLCRKGLLKYTETEAPYVNCHVDNTVPGSRSGAAAAACWATVMNHGREGYAQVAAECMRVREYLAAKFREVPGTLVFPARVNILTVRLPAPLDEDLRKRYCIVLDTFPEPLSSDMRNGAGFIRRTQGVYRFTVMPHVTEEKISQFFAEWQR